MVKLSGMNPAEYEHQRERIEERKVEISALNLTENQLVALKDAAEVLMIPEFYGFRRELSPNSLEEFRKLPGLTIPAYHRALNLLYQTLHGKSKLFHTGEDPIIIYQALLGLLNTPEMRIVSAKTVSATQTQG